MIHLAWWVLVLNGATLLVLGAAIGAAIERSLFRRRHGRAIAAVGRMITGPSGKVTHSFRYPNGKGEADLLNPIPPEDRSSLMALWRDAR